MHHELRVGDDTEPANAFPSEEIGNGFGNDADAQAVSSLLAEEYMGKNPGTVVQVNGGGSGTGIAALLNGTADLAQSSRPMKGDEKEKAKAAGEEGADGADAIGELPFLTEGEKLTLQKLLHEQHFTQPPPRFSEATLVKELEERGIGRPSTYASIMGTIVDRGYVMKRGSALIPSFLAFAVTEFHSATPDEAALSGVDDVGSLQQLQLRLGQRDAAEGVSH